MDPALQALLALIRDLYDDGVLDDYVLEFDKPELAPLEEAIQRWSEAQYPGAPYEDLYKS